MILLFSSFPPSFLYPSLPALPNILSHSTGTLWLASGNVGDGMGWDGDAAVALYVHIYIFFFSLFLFFLSGQPGTEKWGLVVLYRCNEGNEMK